MVAVRVQSISTTDIRSGASAFTRWRRGINQLFALIDVFTYVGHPNSAPIAVFPVYPMRSKRLRCALRSRRVNRNWLLWLDGRDSRINQRRPRDHIFPIVIVDFQPGLLRELPPSFSHCRHAGAPVGADKHARSTGGQYIEQDAESLTGRINLSRLLTTATTNVESYCSDIAIYIRSRTVVVTKQSHAYQWDWISLHRKDRKECYEIPHRTNECLALTHRIQP